MRVKFLILAFSVLFGCTPEETDQTAETAAADESGGEVEEIVDEAPEEPVPITGSYLVFEVSQETDPKTVKGFIVGADAQLEQLAIYNPEAAPNQFIFQGLTGDTVDVIITGQNPKDDLVERGIRLNALAVQVSDGANLIAAAPQMVTLPPAVDLKGRAYLQSETNHQGILVYIPGTDYEARTDAEGKYALNKLPAGMHSFAFEKTGFSSGEVAAYEIPSQTPITDILLPKDTGTDAQIFFADGSDILRSKKALVAIKTSQNAHLMMVSADAEFKTAEWREVESSFYFEFADEGPHTLYVKLADPNGLETVFSRDLLIDTLRPEVVSADTKIRLERSWTVTLSEPLLATSLTDTSLQLLDEDGNVLDRTVALDGEVLTVSTDAIPVTHAARLSLVLSTAVADESGFGMAEAVTLDLRVLGRVSRGLGSWFGKNILPIGDRTDDGVVDYAVSEPTQALAGKVLFMDGASLEIYDEIASPLPSAGFGGSIALLGENTLLVGNGNIDDVYAYDLSDNSQVFSMNGDTPDFAAGVSVKALGDLNNDSHLDFAVVDGRYTSGLDQLGRVWVRSGLDQSPLYELDGNTVNTNAIPDIATMRIADQDNDGVEDFLMGLALSTAASTLAHGETRLISGADGSMIGNWVGTSDATRTGCFFQPINDFDGDGTPDFLEIKSNYYCIGTTTLALAEYIEVRVLSGKWEDGAFAKLASFTTPRSDSGWFANAGITSIADISGDGLEEIVTTDTRHNEIYIFASGTGALLQTIQLDLEDNVQMRRIVNKIGDAIAIGIQTSSSDELVLFKP